MTFSRGLKYCLSYTICIFSSALCAVRASVVFQVCEHHCRVNESFRKHPSANNTCWGSSLVNMSHPLSAFSPTPTTDGNRCLCTKTHKRLVFFWCKNCHPYALGIHVRGKINASIVSLIAFVDSCFKWRGENFGDSLKCVDWAAAGCCLRADELVRADFESRAEVLYLLLLNKAVITQLILRKRTASSRGLLCFTPTCLTDTLQ